MSNTRQWETLFGTMGWSGATFGVGNYTDGYVAGERRACGPSDQIQYLLEGWMRDDPWLVDAFHGAENIKRMGVRPGVDYQQAHRCYIYSGAVDAELITLAETQRYDVFVEAVFPLTSITTPGPGAATLASLLDYIAWFLKQHENVTVVTAAKPGGVDLCEAGTLVRPFQTLIGLDEKTQPGQQLPIYSQTIQATFTALIDHPTGRFYNLVH